MLKGVILFLALACLFQAQIVPIPGIYQSQYRPSLNVNNARSQIFSRVNSVLYKNLIPYNFRPNVEYSRNYAAQLYHGSADVRFSTEMNRIMFYATLIRNTRNCNFARCYHGWINNYTVTGDDTVIGYSNLDLLAQPVFSFNTNSETDFQILRSPNLESIWGQIIELFLQKVNPQLTNSRVYSTRRGFLPFYLPRYNFRTISESQLNRRASSGIRYLQQGQQTTLPNLLDFSELKSGDLFAKVSENITLQQFDTTKSNYDEQVVLNQDGQVRLRLSKYNLALKSDLETQDSEEGQVQGFDGDVTVKVELVAPTYVLDTQVEDAQNYLSQHKKQNLDTVYTYEKINQNRDNEGTLINLKQEQDQIEEPEPNLEDSVFENEESTGVDVSKELEKAGSEENIEFSNNLNVDEDQSAGNNRRLLAANQKFTIFNQKKTLINKKILGKTFKAQVEVTCYNNVLPKDHQIQCVGKFIYALFGKTKTIKLFDFKKTVNLKWSRKKKYQNSWDFSIWVGLPKPINFAGITFSFKVGYVVDLSLTAQPTPGENPYKYSIKALATTQLDTDAKASLKVLVIKGGVFLKGALLKAGTDPTVTLSYYFSQKKVVILAQWFFWISAFDYKWGFFYRKWRLFKGWTGDKIIKQWKIKKIYKKYTIYNKSRTFKF